MINPTKCSACGFDPEYRHRYGCSRPDEVTVKKFQTLEQENSKLREIAKLCLDEMNDGFDLPSDVFDAVNKYYAWKKKQDPDNDGKTQE